MHKHSCFYRNTIFEIIRTTTGENMKFLSTMSLLGFLCTTPALAGHEVIGETKECAIQTKVIQKTSKEGSSLLVIHDRDVYELVLVNQVGRMKFYTSTYQEESPDKFMTFEATIMSAEMSRLSEIKIYLSGVMMNCLIDK